MTDTMQTSEVLNRAADLIEERGWGKGNCAMSASPNAPLCLEGALGAVLGVDTYDSGPHGQLYDYDKVQKTAPYAALASYIGRTLAPHPELWSWNDIQADGSAVVETLRACAVIEAARECQPAEVSA